MSQLIKWDKEHPTDFYQTVTHLWLQHEDGKVEVCRKWQSGDDCEDDTYAIHADRWGDAAWDNSNRGYYSEEYALVTAHDSRFQANTDLLNKLARKFKNAVYHS